MLSPVPLKLFHNSYEFVKEAKSKKQAKVKEARVLSYFNGDAAQRQLTLTQDEIITIVCEDAGEAVKRNGNQGIASRSHIEVLTPPSYDSKAYSHHEGAFNMEQPLSHPYEARVLHKFDATKHDELSVAQGELITVGDNWAKGGCTCSKYRQKKGYVPTSCFDTKKWLRKQTIDKIVNKRLGEVFHVLAECEMCDSPYGVNLSACPNSKITCGQYKHLTKDAVSVEEGLQQIDDFIKGRKAAGKDMFELEVMYKQLSEDVSDEDHDFSFELGLDEDVEHEELHSNYSSGSDCEEE